MFFLFFYPFNIKYLKVMLHVMFVKHSLLYRNREIEPGTITVRLQVIVSREQVDAVGGRKPGSRLLKHT